MYESRHQTSIYMHSVNISLYICAFSCLTFGLVLAHVLCQKMEEKTLRETTYDRKYALKCTDLDDKFEKFSGGNTPEPPKLGRATLPRSLPRGAQRRARGLRPLPCTTAKTAPPTSIPSYAPGLLKPKLTDFC
jgi:hypothetical protein